MLLFSTKFPSEIATALAIATPILLTAASRYIQWALYRQIIISSANTSTTAKAGYQTDWSQIETSSHEIEEENRTFLRTLFASLGHSLQPDWRRLGRAEKRSPFEATAATPITKITTTFKWPFVSFHWLQLFMVIWMACHEVKQDLGENYQTLFLGENIR